jgi:hypothetical protein
MASDSTFSCFSFFSFFFSFLCSSTERRDRVRERRFESCYSYKMRTNTTKKRISETERERIPILEILNEKTERAEA